MGANPMTIKKVHFLYFPNNPFTDRLSATHMMSFSEDGSGDITVELMEWKRNAWEKFPLGSLKTVDPKGWKALAVISPGAAQSENSQQRFGRPRARRLWCCLKAVGWKWQERT